jgi:ferric-dicitrate binding protein FerR (iron transport regulator)
MGRTATNSEQIARYLAGRLSASETREFEALYSGQPDIVQELEETARFREGLAALRERGEIEALVRTQPRRGRWVQFGIAASLAILFVGGALWVGLTHTVAPVLFGCCLEHIGHLSIRHEPRCEEHHAANRLADLTCGLGI